MRIAQITPGVIPIPPNGWGAVEKIIWEYTKVLRSLGHEVEILYADDVKPGEWDVVHVHMANLCLLFQQRGIPYVYSFHDHHAYHYGKDSHVFQENKKAIEGSLLTFVHAKFLIDYFDVPGKIRYLGHGANLKDYFFEDQSIKVLKGNPSLVMMANNGLAGDKLYDRKGFGPGIEAARQLDLPITIICKSDPNKQIIEGFPPYDKLTVKYDLDYSQSIEELRKHQIFLNPSMLEAGHPNLTVVESICMGIPVVSTSESQLPGVTTVALHDLKVSPNELADAIRKVISEYSSFVLECKQKRGIFSWEVVVSRMLMDYTSFLAITQKKLLLDSYDSVSIKEQPESSQSGFFANFTINPLIYKSKETESDVSVSFIDMRTDEIIHRSILGSGARQWVRPADISDRYIKWKIVVKFGTTVLYSKVMQIRNEHVLVNGTHYVTEEQIEKLLEFQETTGCILTIDSSIKDVPFFYKGEADPENFYRVLNLTQLLDFFNPKRKKEPKTVVEFSSSALGDNIAFIPYANELGKKRDCKIYVKCNHEHLFDGLFDYIQFTKETDCTEYILVNYLFDEPLQKGFAKQLGLDYAELRPKVRKSKVKPPSIKGKYFCFSMHSTAQAKHWNNNNSWENLCEGLQKEGIQGVCIDRYRTFGIEGHWNEIPSNCVDMTGGDLDHMMALIEGSEFFVGLSSGLSWLAHAVGKKVVLISGVTNPDNEFSIDSIRIHRSDVCNSCFNNPKEHKFDPNNWLWCPIHHGTSRQFECTKKISAHSIIKQLKEKEWI